MYTGKLIGDLFDAVERTQNSTDRSSPKNEIFPLPAEAIPEKRDRPVASTVIARIVPADV
jgi:hypothetical protein